MTTKLSLKEAPQEFKKAILKELDFSVSEGFILNSKGVKVIDRYIKKPVKFNNFLIFPGSTIILDDNPLSVNSYLEEFGEDVLR